MFKEVSSRVDFPKMEEKVLRLWAEEQTFQASLTNRADAPEYLFYDGPPFATGLPHYGHLLAGTIKDIAKTKKNNPISEVRKKSKNFGI